uniref:Putative secreted protein n=1 Tax=Ixodes ricinus TaxID=34613 RepID=A0A6B0UMI3_IXORI
MWSVFFMCMSSLYANFCRVVAEDFWNWHEFSGSTRSHSRRSSADDRKTWGVVATRIRVRRMYEFFDSFCGKGGGRREEETMTRPFSDVVFRRRKETNSLPCRCSSWSSFCSSHPLCVE